MRTPALAFALCLLGAAHMASAASLQDGEQRPRQRLDPGEQQLRRRVLAPGVADDRRRRTRASDHWLSLMSGKSSPNPRNKRSMFDSNVTEIAHVGTSNDLDRSRTSAAAGGGSSSVILPPPIKIDSAAGVTSIQLVLIPVPMPAQCPQQPPSTSILPSLSPVINENLLGAPQQEPLQSAPRRDRPPSVTREESPPSADTPSPRPPAQAPRPAPSRGRRPGPPRLPAAPSTPNSSTKSRPPTPPEPPTPSEVRRARNTPRIGPVGDSRQLLQLFRAQVLSTPSLPPVVIEPLVVATPGEELVEVPDPAATSDQFLTPNGNGPYERPQESARCLRTCQQGSSDPPAPVDTDESPPPLPRFERSLKLQAVLTVPRAGFSEPYILWWDAASGASRMDHHSDTASSYRIMRHDGTMQSVHMRRDRTEEVTVRRCLLSAPRRVSLVERSLPVLPDLSGFTFAGYIEAPPAPGGVPSRVERWRQTVSAAAERGELLTYRHELLVARAPDGFTCTPLRYAVAVDSSELGVNCDAYIHRFIKVTTRHQDSGVFHLDIGDACDQIETTNRIELVEPLREFALLQRDPMYDGEFQRYKVLYERRYADDLEDMVRKNILIQSYRFVSSGNREGASFEMELGFLGDRLAVERHPFNGVEFSAEISGNNFPHTREELRNSRGRMPRKFDWRDLGAVTSVRNQSQCASCWAFSVVGAVEGALFLRTNRLVELSEQVLLDCGHKTGAKGCSGTWPARAYDYVREYGLPALDEYYPYESKVQQCEAKVAPSVTHISGFVNVTARNVLALKVAIQHHGPTVVLMDGDQYSFHHHKSGFYYDAKCKKQSSTHAMLAVGWTVHRGETYFIMKNSWSTGWGEDGYIQMRARTNTCGILRLPTYPLLAKRDVKRVPGSALSAAAPPLATYHDANDT